MVMAMARSNITKASSTSGTSKVKISRVSRRILLKSLLNNSTSSSSMLTPTPLIRIRRASMPRFLCTLRPLTQIVRILSSGGDCDHLYLIVSTLLLYSIGEMSVDSRVSCDMDVMRSGYQLTSLLTAFGFLVSCFTEFCSRIASIYPRHLAMSACYSQMEEKCSARKILCKILYVIMYSNKRMRRR